MDGGGGVGGSRCGEGSKRGSDAEGVERGGVEAGEGYEVDAGLVGGDGCVLEIDHAVAETGHSDSGEGRGYGAHGEVGGVVVVREVAEEDVAQLRGVDSGEKFGGDAVVEMAVGGLDAGLEIFGIAAVAEHVQVVVGLDDDVVGLPHVVVDALADAAEIGGYGETAVAVGDVESGVVGAVVHDVEGCHFEVADAEGELLVDWRVVVLDAARDVVAAQDAVEGLGGAEDAQMAVAAQQGIDVADVVAVVVGETDSGHAVHRDAVAAQTLGHAGHLDSGVDQEASLTVADIGAVARTAASEAHEEDAVVGLKVGKSAYDRLLAAVFARDLVHPFVGDDVEVVVSGSFGEIFERVEKSRHRESG